MRLVRLLIVRRPQAASSRPKALGMASPPSVIARKPALRAVEWVAISNLYTTAFTRQHNIHKFILDSPNHTF